MPLIRIDRPKKPLCGIRAEYLNKSYLHGREVPKPGGRSEKRASWLASSAAGLQATSADGLPCLLEAKPQDSSRTPYEVSVGLPAHGIIATMSWARRCRLMRTSPRLACSSETARALKPP